MKYKWRYLDKIKPIKKANALYLGEVLHLAFHSYYNGSSDDKVLKDIIAYMDNFIAECPPEEQETFIIQKYTLIGMWKAYPFKDLSIFSKIESEKEIRLKLEDDLEFVCKVDRILTVKKTGLMWIGELKTTGVPFSQFVNRVNISAQASFYVWVLRRMGERVSGVLYDFVKKPMLRKGVHEDCYQFGQRITDDYIERPENYYGQHYEYRSDMSISLFEEDIFKMVESLRMVREKGCYFRNQDNCWKYQYECPYMKICFTEVPDPLTLELYFSSNDKENLNKMKGGEDNE